MFQIWSEWEAGYEGPTTDSGRNLAWTQSPHIRSYGEIYRATGDTQWLDRMAMWLDDVMSRCAEHSCHGVERTGWLDTAYDTYYPVHQGRILTAFLEFARIVAENPVALAAYQSTADEYVALAEQVAASCDDLFQTTTAGGTTVGYFRFPAASCSEAADWRVGPHNQSLAMGTALVLLHTLTGGAPHLTKVDLLAAGLRHDLVHVSGHYQWPYWPSYSEAYGGGNVKAEDQGHGSIDVEFAYYAHLHGMGGLSSTDLSRLAHTLTDVSDRSTPFGTRHFALRVDGTLCTNPDNVSKVDNLQPGWLWLQQFAPEVVALGQAWCTNNKPHAHALLQRLGGPVLACPGWCPAADLLARFDNGAPGGWTSYAGCTGYANPSSPEHGDEEKLQSRRGNGTMRSAEQSGGGDHGCDPAPVGAIEMNRYLDLDLSQAGLGPRLHVSGFSRSQSAYSGASNVTNRCAKLIDTTTSSVIASQCQAFADTTDSGWVPFDLDLTDDVAGLANVRIVIGMYDSWANDWSQEVRLDEVRICTQEFCGDAQCGAGEDATNCPTDCAP